MKVLFLINCLSYGGAEKNMKLVAEHLSANGDDVTVCSLNYQPTTINFSNNIKILELFPRTGHFLNLLRLKYFELKEIIKNVRPDVIISFLGYANLLNVLLGKRLNIPCIISERADPYLKSSSWAANSITRLFQWIYTFADGAVFQTAMARDFFGHRLQRRSVVIPNPVVLPNEIPVHDFDLAEKKIAFVGRFELKQKRQDIALQAFQKVLKTHPEYILYFYGDGNDESKVRQMVKTMKLEKNVFFESVSDHILYDISNSELFILSSDYEGIPNCLIEAMSIGLPCVSTDCSPGGARVLIDNNENGIIVPRGDSTRLAEAICFYIENPIIAQQHGIKAQKIKNKYSMTKIMKSWEQYIHSFKKS